MDESVTDDICIGAIISERNALRARVESARIALQRIKDDSFWTPDTEEALDLVNAWLEEDE